MVAVILLAATVRIPVENEAGDTSMRMFLMFLFSASSVIAFSLFLYRRINKQAGAFLALALFSAVVPSLLLSGFTIIFTKQSFEAVIALVAGMALYASFVCECSKTERFMIAMGLAGIVHAAVLFFNINKHIGLMTNRDDAAAFVALCSVSFMNRRLWPLLIIPCVALILIGAAGGAVAFVAAGVFSLLVYRKEWWIRAFVPVASIVLVAAYFLFVDAPSVDVRTEAWIPSIQKAFLNYWGVGVGIGNWRIFHAALYKEGFISPLMGDLHNTFIELFIEIGPLAIALVGWYALSVYRRARGHFKELSRELSALVVISICCCVNSFFAMNAINALFAVVWMALLEIKLRRIENEKSVVCVPYCAFLSD
jgi:hypothetical protein